MVRVWQSVTKGTVAAALLALVVAGCDPFGDDWSWHQKLTVEVMTPEGPRTGSAVTYVGWNDIDAFDNYHANYRGEATVVDLGSGRFLFALIGEPTKQIAAYTLHQELGERRNDYPALFPKIAAFRGVREVPRDHYPLLVTFDDIAKPETVREVDPASLKSTFGPGFALQHIFLEIADAKGTKGKVEATLPWLSDPSVMENPGWKSLPLESRRAISGLLTDFKDLGGSSK